MLHDFTTDTAQGSQKVVSSPILCAPLQTERGTFNSYAAYQAAREANPSESDLQLWEKSARRGLKSAALGSAVWRECMTYIVACSAARKAPGTNIHVLLALALEQVNALQTVVLPQ